MTMRSALFCFLLLTAIPASARAAQQIPTTPPPRPGTVPAEEAATIAHGWALLGQGNAAEAAARAAQVLKNDPRNAAALLLAVEAQFLSHGALAGLDEYERWLGSRAIEEAGVLRRIARAVLREEANQRQDAAARSDALRALVADRDAAVVGELRPTADESGSSRLLAEMGDQKAVNTLLAHMKNGAVDPALALPVLARSGNPIAVSVSVDRLSDARQEVRGAAAEALGVLGAREHIPRLQAMLRDPSSFVQVKAAAALFEMGDDTGVQLLRQLMQDEAAASRLVAVQAMASRPDAAWLAAVRGLTDAAEPEIRVGAARLLAPHDPGRARAVLDRLASHENIAIRELVATARPATAGRDLTALRQLMRSPERLTRVAAAAQTLEITR